MKHSEIRQHIIKTASELFYENGFNNTGINEIIAKSGIAKATLYNHFNSKDEVCIAYLKYKQNSFMTTLREFIASKATGKAQLLGIFDFLKTFYSSPSFNGCWCIRTIAEIPEENVMIRQEIQQQKKELQQFLLQIVRSNIQDISKTESKKVANGLYLLYEGAVGETHLHQSDWPIKTAKAMGELLIK